MHDSSNILARSVAIAAGAAATTGALTLLCADAWTTGNWTIQHVLLPLVILLAIVSGWLVEHTIRRREWLYVLPLTFVFMFASCLTIYQSVGGQKEKAAVKASSAETHNAALVDTKAAIGRAENERALARDMLRQAERSLQVQCVDGKKSKAHCDGIRATVSTYRGSEKGHGVTVTELQAKLQTLGGELVARPKAEAFGELAGAFGFDAKAAATIAATLEPFSFPLLFEVVAILAFGYGFRPAPTAKRTRVEITPEPGPALVATTATATQPERRDGVHDFVAAHVARYGHPPQIAEVQKMHFGTYGVKLAKSTAGRWRSEAIESVQPVQRLRIVG